MRVLLAVPSRTDNLHNAVPLGWGLRTGGHQVLVAARPAFTAAITRTGLVAAEVGDPAGDPDWLADPAAVADLLAVVGRWEPEVVLWDRRAPAGAAAAALAGVASVCLTGYFDAGLSAADVVERLSGALAGNAAGRAATPSAHEALDGVAATLDATPSSLAGPVFGRRIPVRPVAYTGPAVVPVWLRREPRRRRVCVVLGGGTAPVAEVFDAVGALDAETVAVVSVAAVPPGTVVPADVRLVDSVPLDAVVRTCAAVVHDGDAGAWTAAAVTGVPQLDVVGTDPERLPERVRALLSDQAERSAAEGLRAEIAATPTPVAAVARLAELVAARPRIVGDRLPC